MPGPVALELLSGPRPVTGNTAKVKVLCELMDRIAARRAPPVILDVGCIGLQPLELWDPVLRMFPTVQLVGVDVAGIDRARRVVRERGWTQVTLHESSGYALERLFAAATFDLIVATQVLEHMAQPVRFLRQAARVVRPGGEVFLTVDSAHWLPRFTVRRPLRLVKNVGKRVLARLGRERHYDLPWGDREIEAFARAARLEVAAIRYYNVHPMKFIHNHLVPPALQNAFLQLWFGQEELLNDQLRVDARLKRLCMDLYVHLRRPAADSQDAPEGHR